MEQEGVRPGSEGNDPIAAASEEDCEEAGGGVEVCVDQQ